MPVIGGTVLDSAGAPADRELRFYRRDTGAFLGRSRSSGGDGDPDFDKVSLLLPMDGANGSTAFTDSSPAPKTVTAFGNVKISTVQSKFGGASAYFDGDGDYLSASYDSGFDLSAGDFTLECFFSRTSSTGNASYGCLLSKRLSGGDWDYGIEFNGLFLSFRFGGAGAMSCGTVSLNTWHHVAVCRSGGTVYCFLDGALQSSSAETMRNRAIPLMIGRSLTDWSDNQFAGFIDDLRITKGVARYTASFTTPAAPFPDIPSPGRTMPLGEYYFATNYTSEVQVVCVDDASEPLENDLILRTFPV